MLVTLGVSLDDRQGQSGRSYFSEPVLGPMGFLALLETHLGAAGPSTSHAQRVAEYLGFLKLCDNADRFYSRALQADDIGTAAELLSWRDEWRLGGWKGTFCVQGSLRLRDMADVEVQAVGRMTPGLAERLEMVCMRLAERSVPVRGVQLLDPLERFPRAWRMALQFFECKPPPIPTISHTGRLGEVQHAALAAVKEGVMANALAGVGDNSILVLQAYCRETAEHWLSARCRHQYIDRLLICEANGPSLDDTLRTTGAARCGFDQSSASRPALQAASLTIETLWAPIDVTRLIEFLTHRFGPFALRARRVLARALTEQPGIGSEAWEAAKASIREFEDGEALLLQIAFWFEGDRWMRADGAPIDAVMLRVERLKQSLRSRMGSDDVAEAKAAAAGVMQVDGVRASLVELRRQGQQRVLPRQLEQIVAQATTSGAGNPLAIAEVGCWKSATSAAASSVENAAEVIWWMPSSPQLPCVLPWSTGELATLHDNDVEVRDQSEEVSALAAQWLRPLLAATDRFIIVLPPPGFEEHPLWQLIRQVAPETPVVSIEAELHAGRHPTIARQIDRLPLPDLRGPWEIGSPVISRFERQSYTSLSDLFGNPAVSVLKDAAALRNGASVAVQDNNRLLGNLAHRLVEVLLSQADVLTWPEDKVRSWHGPAVEILVRKEGAPLFSLGAKMFLERFRHVSLTGILCLLDHLRASGVIRTETEVELVGVLGDVPLVGKIDLLVELPQGRFAAIDLKWSGATRHANLLRDGVYLQLALYAGLLLENRGSLPVTIGYFVFDKPELLVLNDGIFPQGRVCAPKHDITPEDVLKMAKASWQWRARQLASGSVDVVDTRIASLDEFQGPDATYPVAPLGPWNNAFVPLFGWSEQ